MHYLCSISKNSKNWEEGVREIRWWTNRRIIVTYKEFGLLEADDQKKYFNWRFLGGGHEVGGEGGDEITDDEKEVF